MREEFFNKDDYQSAEMCDGRQLHLWPQPNVETRPCGLLRVEPKRYSLTTGDVVAVFGLSVSGAFIEGFAIIERPGSRRDHYHVRFKDERTSQVRFVNPNWQADPQRSLALLREFWCSSGSDNPSFEDFFPDTHS